MSATPEQKKRYFLEDTRDILVDYDGNRTVEGLMGLINETKERLDAYLNDGIEAYENE